MEAAEVSLASSLGNWLTYLAAGICVFQRRGVAVAKGEWQQYVSGGANTTPTSYPVG